MASTLTNLLYHIVFSTKDREPLIRDSFRDELEKYIAGIVRNERGILARYRWYARPSSPHREIQTGPLGRRHGPSDQGQFVQMGQ